ncbi:hypothetical protein [Vibrio coralliilyticus]|nr:hypothetical protein [Vibrio coralliilyticus]
MSLSRYGRAAAIPKLNGVFPVDAADCRYIWRHNERIIRLENKVL